MTIQLSDHFTYRKLIRFTLPSITMMIFTSIYGMVDGFFVSNYVGSIPFASLNLVMPFIMILSAVGFMFGTGGTALVSMTLGMGNKKKANEIFSLLVYVLFGCGVCLALFGALAAPQVSTLLGATKQMMPYAILYIRISMISLPFFMLQNLFQSFLVTAERPKLGLKITILAGCTNMFLDWLFVGHLGWGLAGAALATVISEITGGSIPLCFFFLPNSTTLRLGKTHMDTQAILKASTNGASEFLSNAATSLVGMLYNLQLLRYAGTNGVAAYGVIMYVNFIFASIFFGYTMGISPIVGYHYGAQHTDELKGLLRKSTIMILITSLVLTIFSEVGATFLVRIFVGYDAALMALTVHGFHLYSLSYLTMGYNTFGSGFFTALNNGRISAFLSIMRTLILQLIAIYALPLLLGADGLWLVTTLANTICFFLTIWTLSINREEYQY